MSLKPKIEELSSLIKKIEDEAARFHAEGYNLRQQRAGLIARMLVEEKLMEGTEWEMTLDHNSIARLSLKKDDEGKMNYVEDLARDGWHSSFEIESGVTLQFDDNEISIEFQSAKMMIPFAKKNGMKVSGTTLTNKLSQLKRDVAALEIVCHQFNLDKK